MESMERGFVIASLPAEKPWQSRSVSVSKYEIASSLRSSQ